MSLPGRGPTDALMAAARMQSSEEADVRRPGGPLPRPRGATRSNGHPRKLVVRLATDRDRDVIYRLRHEVYARELGQYPTNAEGRLTDSLDPFNVYLVATSGDEIVGFVSITPPGHDRYSVDKYFRRDQLPFPVDDRLYELRLLTVLPSARRWVLALTLMYAAFRWVESHGATRFMAIGRHEVLSMYHRVGMKEVGLTVRAGAVLYHLMHATMQDVQDALPGIGNMLDRIEADVDWQFWFPYRTPATCYHGGAFFEAIGPEFSTLERRQDIINADVLDAWFPPSPKALAAVGPELAWLLKTSPPTGCEGLVRAIARVRGVPERCVLPGAGSSDLIFRALRHWLGASSRALILDPGYGEYPHVLERVIRCHVDRLFLVREEHYRLDPDRLAERLAAGYDLVVLVNPNSPTGQLVSRQDLERVLRAAPARTRIWVDETYIDYAGTDQSLERFAAASENVVVCKSMSKVYALSGSRVAYLCGGAHQVESLRAITPPWIVSLPAQFAAVHALQDPDYYHARYRETHDLRRQLLRSLESLGLDAVDGYANFVLCHLAAGGPDAPTVVARCRERGLFIRDAETMGSQFGRRAIRVSVKDPATNRRIAEILGQALR